VPKSRSRERNPTATRARIAQAALELFERQGYVGTTIDEIAEAAGVGRRTIFEHFPTKQAMLFDHLVVRREVALQRLKERPESEPPLVSLHAVMRDLCQAGYDQAFLDQIRAVLEADPTAALPELSRGTMTFQHNVIATLQSRAGSKASLLELHALTEMVSGWFLTAIRIYFKERRRSLVRCFDDVVAACVRATADDLRGAN
jgi:AcrR family transcriptional regulator